ncbi:MAG: PAS domain-containing protein [Janthinobacterium lividum]
MQDLIKILVVDDDALDRRAVKQALRNRHQEAVVQEAASCSEATEAIKSGQFDCIILDYHLPDGTGMSCLIDVREAGITTPIILLTGQGDEKIAAEAIRAGATDYLPKSDITPQILDHCLRSALRFHQSQEQIRRTYDELRLRDRAIAASSNGIVISDPSQPDCPIIYCNPAFSTMTGYSSEEVFGNNCRFLQGSETDAAAIQQIRDCLHQEISCQIILRNYKKDGTPFWNALTISPVRDPEGKLTHFIGVQTDITERREAEDALRQSVVRQQALLRDMFSSVTEGKLSLCGSKDELPTVLSRFSDPLPLSAGGGIRELRQNTVSACLAVGIPDARRYDLETAVGEAAMNAVVHSGTGTGHVFTHERGTVQVRVEDEGKGIAVADLPNATLRRGFSTAGTMGHGFKMILKTVDRVHLLTGDTGTTVVVEQDRTAPVQSW